MAAETASGSKPNTRQRGPGPPLEIDHPDPRRWGLLGMAPEARRDRVVQGAQHLRPLPLERRVELGERRVRGPGRQFDDESPVGEIGHPDQVGDAVDDRGATHLDDDLVEVGVELTLRHAGPSREAAQGVRQSPGRGSSGCRSRRSPRSWRR